jgi:uncharacterized repeat protein (TIGR03803 family)
MTPDHVITTIHTFQGSDGRLPNGLVQGPNGNLYGTTQLGGTAGNGVVFEISTDGSLFTVLHNFGDGTITHDGKNPVGSLLVGPDKFPVVEVLGLDFKFPLRHNERRWNRRTRNGLQNQPLALRFSKSAQAIGLSENQESGDELRLRCSAFTP